MLWLFIGCIVGFYLVVGLGVYVWTSFVQIVKDVDIQMEQEQQQLYNEMDMWKGETLDAAYEMAWEINDCE